MTPLSMRVEFGLFDRIGTPVAPAESSISPHSTLDHAQIQAYWKETILSCRRDRFGEVRTKLHIARWDWAAQLFCQARVT